MIIWQYHNVIANIENSTNQWIYDTEKILILEALNVSNCCKEIFLITRPLKIFFIFPIYYSLT